MKTRVVEHPDSTTIWMEVPFHLIRNEAEMRNALGNSKPEEVILFAFYIDEKTYQPRVRIIVPIRVDDYGLLAGSNFYDTTLELLYEAGLQRSAGKFIAREIPEEVT